MKRLTSLIIGILFIANIFAQFNDIDTSNIYLNVTDVNINKHINKEQRYPKFALVDSTIQDSVLIVAFLIQRSDTLNSIDFIVRYQDKSYMYKFNKGLNVLESLQSSRESDYINSILLCQCKYLMYWFSQVTYDKKRLGVKNIYREDEIHLALRYALVPKKECYKCKK